MTMELIPPTLDDIGRTLWDSNWRENLAEALETTPNEISGWETDPAKRPANLEKQIDHLCVRRLQEIMIVRELVQETGLARFKQ
jgi:hypothetical protein